MIRLALETLGCKTNLLEGEALRHHANKQGFTLVGSHEKADAYIINSCTVTSAADRQTRQLARQFKRQNPLALVAVIGCYSQVAVDQITGLSEIDLAFGTANKLDVIDELTRLLSQPDWHKVHVSPATGFLPEEFAGGRFARASIKIQDGCNLRCSYCIIPKARGKSISLAPDIILEQVRSASLQGFHEVVLTGVHLAHYGWDMGTDLLQLVRLILDANIGPRIRLSTFDPIEISDELIELMSTGKLCPHFHIALQSGSDNILRKMRRSYLVRHFVSVTEKIRQANADAFVGVDVMVGFPGERDCDFETTLHCLEKTFWSKLHVFPYSERSGTDAAGYADKIAATKINERANIVRNLSAKRLESFLNSQIGKDFEVILEKPLDDLVYDKPMWQGHTENYLCTATPNPSCHPAGSLTKAKALRVENGRIVTS